MLLTPLVLLTVAAQPPEPHIGPSATREQILDINRVWRGFGVGYDGGLVGRSFAHGLKLVIPFGYRIGQFIGARVRGLMVYPEPGADDFDPVVDMGLELFGRGPVLLGILRPYGGGGAWVGVRPNPTQSGDQWAVGGGGHFGIEALVARRISFTFEVGGQSGGHDLGLDTGATVMGGMMVYLGATR